MSPAKRRVRQPEPKPAAKKLKGSFELQEHDGLTYVYDGGVRHSRKGIAPVDQHEREVLNAVVDLLNYGEASTLPLSIEANSMYVRRLW